MQLSMIKNKLFKNASIKKKGNGKCCLFFFWHTYKTLAMDEGRTGRERERKDEREWGRDKGREGRKGKEMESTG